MLRIIFENKDCEQFCIKRKISNRIMYLIVQNTNVKKIFVSQAIAKQLPKKLASALEKIGVKVVVTKPKRGRKRIYDVNKMKKILKTKKSLREISKKEKIPLRTLYYYKNKNKKCE